MITIKFKEGSERYSKEKLCLYFKLFRVFLIKQPHNKLIIDNEKSKKQQEPPECAQQ
jgi:hypothetical protein